MRIAWHCIVLILAGVLFAQESVYVCPMDPDVRSSRPGTCSRCGMKLEAGIPDPIEYPVDFRMTPGKNAQRLEFTVRNPWNGAQVSRFQPVHEKLFHLFVVSRDLEFFVHEHPALGADGRFRAELAFPHGGMYRVLGDFYPEGGTPQMAVKTAILSGAPQPAAKLAADFAAKDSSNLRVELVADPPQPVAGSKTMLFFRVTPAEGLEQYLGAWGHLLAASDDLIDMIHDHPFTADGTNPIQFNVIFPRARVYRIWVQFQRGGVVNTAHFDVPVRRLE